MLGTFGCQSLVPLALEDLRFASIWAWVDKNHRLFSLWGQSGFEGVGCHVFILAKKYCLSKRKHSSSGFFFFDILYSTIGRRLINFKRTGTSLIIILNILAGTMGKLCAQWAVEYLKEFCYIFVFKRISFNM